MKIKRFFINRVLWLAIALSIFTGYTRELLNLFFSNSEMPDNFADFLALPGALIIGKLFPQGPHTDNVGVYWGYCVGLTNFLIYFIVWYALLCLIRKIVSIAKFKS